VTPNGKVAVVRGNNSTPPGQNDDARLSFWRTDNGGRIYPNNQTGHVGRGNLPLNSTTGVAMFSDAIAVTNDRVVAIGSADTDPNHGGEETIYVDILALDYSSGVPTVTVLPIGGAPFALTGTPPYTDAGDAHDVAITPDGSTAVVTCSNWILVFNLGDGTILQSFNVGSGGAGACMPFTARNSVEVTDSRAVVTMGREATISGGTVVVPWVYIVDLAADPPSLRLEFNQGDQVTGPRQNPHDIAISPNGWKAVVTASYSVGLYDLTTCQLSGSVDRGGDERYWGYVPGGEPGVDLWHSVEVSNSRAVVIGNFQGPSGPQWSVRVFDISRGLAALRAYQGPADQPGDEAWDLDLSGDGQMASIKTWAHDLALLDVPSSGNQPSDLFWAGPALAAYPPPSGVSYPSSSSGHYGINSATVMLAQVGSQPTHRWAAFLGGVGTNQSNLRLYDLDASDWTEPGPAVQTFTQVPSSGTLAPADLERTPDETDVLVRNSGPFAESSYPGGPDWGRWGGSPPAQVGTTMAGQGLCSGADSLRMGRTWAVSISRDPNPQVNGGWVHIVHSLHFTSYP